MKKILAFLMSVMLLCGCMATAFADDYVISPEYDPPEEDPVSPQTGYGAGIGAVMAVALTGGVVAYVSVRKLRREA